MFGPVNIDARRCFRAAENGHRAGNAPRRPVAEVRMHDGYLRSRVRCGLAIPFLTKIVVPMTRETVPSGGCLTSVV